VKYLALASCRRATVRTFEVGRRNRPAYKAPESLAPAGAEGA
jgi:hypothetical protein